MKLFVSVLAFAFIYVSLFGTLTINAYTYNGRETKIEKIFEEGLRKSGSIDTRNRKDIINTLKTGIREIYGRNKRLLELSEKQYSIQDEVSTEDPDLICQRCTVFVGQVVRCYCTGNELDIVEQFTNISRELEANGQSKLFEIIDIWDANIQEFPENSFVDLEFRDIIIEDANNLERIHTNAFNSTAFSVEYDFFLYNSYSTDLLLTNEPPDYDLWAALSSLVNVSYIFISLGRNMEHEIPENAFKNINGLQRNLNGIIFETGYTITRIGEYAFSQLPTLNDGIIDLSFIPIEHISPHAFDFSYQSDRYVDIDLRYCGLIDENFDAGSFLGRNRPIRLFLSHNSIKHISRDVFYDFFDGDHRSIVYFDDNPLNCTDTESFEWLLLSPIRNEYMARIIYPYCENGTEIWHLNVENPNNDTSPTSSPVTCPSVTSCPDPPSATCPPIAPCPTTTATCPPVSCPAVTQTSPSSAPVTCPSVTCAVTACPGDGSSASDLYYFQVILATNIFCFLFYALNISKFV